MVNYKLRCVDQYCHRPSIMKTDHLAACVDIPIQSLLPSTSTKRGIEIADTKEIDLSMLLQSDVVDLKRLDVHTHAAELPKTIVSALLPQCAKLPPHPKKQTTSDRTWQIVLQKREARKLLLLS